MKRKKKHKKIETPLGYEAPSLEQINFYNLMGSIAHGVGIASGGINASHHRWQDLTVGEFKDFLAELRANSMITAELAVVLYSHLPDDDKEKIPQVVDRNEDLIKFGPSKMKKRLEDMRIGKIAGTAKEPSRIIIPPK